MKKTTPVEFVPVTHFDLLHVARNLRESDRRELYGTRFDDDPVSLTNDIMKVGPFSFMCRRKGVPVAAFGAYPMHPGVWSAWAFATPDFPKISLSLTRFVKSSIIPALLKSGMRRAECRSIEGHDAAHRWLEYLGFSREARHPHMGKNGEAFYTYAWTVDDVYPSHPDRQ